MVFSPNHLKVIKLGRNQKKNPFSSYFQESRKNLVQLTEKKTHPEKEWLHSFKVGVRLHSVRLQLF